MTIKMGTLRIIFVFIIILHKTAEVKAAPHMIQNYNFDMMDILNSNEGTFNGMLSRLKTVVDHRKQLGCSVGDAAILENDMVNVVSKSFASVIRTLMMMQDLLQDVTGHFRNNVCREELAYTCLSDQWQCSSGECISNELHCNGEVNCLDSSDESINCSNLSSDKLGSGCSVEEFTCKNDSKCIPSWFRCDTLKDCEDGSDEDGCSETTCSTDQISCGSLGICIMKKWRCDGDLDCLDGSDEEGCPDKETTRIDPQLPSTVSADFATVSTKNMEVPFLTDIDATTCKDSYILCPIIGMCIPKHWQCDGSTDCPDGSDERLCLTMETADLPDVTTASSSSQDATITTHSISTSTAGKKIDSLLVTADAGTCENEGLLCSVKGRTICLPSSWICDVIPDCDDGSDESLCFKTPTPSLRDMPQPINRKQPIFIKMKTKHLSQIKDQGDGSLGMARSTETEVPLSSENIDISVNDISFPEDVDNKQWLVLIVLEKISNIFRSRAFDEVMLEELPSEIRDLTFSYVFDGGEGTLTTQNPINPSAISKIQSRIYELFIQEFSLPRMSSFNFSQAVFKLTLRWRRNPCTVNEYFCIRSNTCLPKDWKCNGKNDCPDGEDEEDCPEKCLADEIYCQQSGECLPEIWRCDGENDCADGSDEKECVHTRVLMPHVMFFAMESGTCRESWFYCNTGNRHICIPDKWVCDGDTDCLSSADEKDCPASVPRDAEFQGRSAEQSSHSDDIRNIIEKPVDTSPATVTTPLHGIQQYIEEQLESLAIPTYAITQGYETTPFVDKEQFTSGKVEQVDIPLTIFQELAYLETEELDTINVENSDYATENTVKSTHVTKSLTDETTAGTPRNDVLNKESCGKDQFYCSLDKKCFALAWKCDGEKDCSDGQDELGCQEDDCNQSGWVKCQNHPNCINSAWLCDGSQDCPDGSDEKNCTYSSTPSATSFSPLVTIRSNYTLAVLNGTCSTETFRCISTDNCIPILWQCDGDSDCPNGEDEQGCSTVTTTTTSSSLDLSEMLKKNYCSNGHVRCITTQKCIPQQWVCDGENDCEDSTDEAYCHLVKNSEESQSKPQMPAISGEFSKDEDTISISGSISINRMALTDLPLQVTTYSPPVTENGTTAVTTLIPSKSKPNLCLNDPGYYQCANGDACYEVSNVCDGVTDCSDNSDEGKGCEMQREGFLLVSLGRRLEAFSLDVRSSSRIHRELHGNIVGVAYDPINREAYWTVLSTVYGGVYRKSISDDQTTPQRFLRSSTNLEGLALDWLGRNLYVADTFNGKIKVCSIVTENCTTLIENIARPRTLQLDLIDRKIYWVDNKTPLIEVAGMDGTHRSVLVSAESLGWINGISLDLEFRRLYWMDGKYDTIEYVDLISSHRQVVANTSGIYPYDVALWKDQLFWTDMLRKQVLTCNKWNCSDARMFTSTAPRTPAGMAVYHPIIFEKAGNPCIGHSCSHLCLLSKSSPDGYKCFCPDYMTLQIDQKTCN